MSRQKMVHVQFVYALYFSDFALNKNISPFHV